MSSKAENPKTNGPALSLSLHHELKKLLDGGQAHATFDDAVRDFPLHLRNVVPEALPYSAWQILEHIRIAQRDILEFSDNAQGGYKSRKWPDEYWPDNPEPPSAEAWDASVRQVHQDQKTFEGLLAKADDTELVEPFAWGDGQTLLREALLIADHNAYHTGELIVLRRLLGAWKK